MLSLCAHMLLSGSSEQVEARLGKIQGLLSNTMWKPTADDGNEMDEAPEAAAVIQRAARQRTEAAAKQAETAAKQAAIDDGVKAWNASGTKVFKQMHASPPADSHLSQVSRRAAPCIDASSALGPRNPRRCQPVLNSHPRPDCSRAGGPGAGD